MPTREDVFDKVLQPLIAAMYEICEQHDIPFVAGFELDPSDTGIVTMGMSMFLPENTRSKDLIELGARLDVDEPPVISPLARRADTHVRGTRP
jgi:hypothetical protein